MGGENTDSQSCSATLCWPIRQVSTEEGEDKAKQENILFIETSAKVSSCLV